MKFKPILILLSAVTAVVASPTPQDNYEDEIFPPTMWVRNFYRMCLDNDHCAYQFLIDTGLGKHKCTVDDSAFLAFLHPFYAVPCRENKDWHISWGWDYKHDFTVMTVLNKFWKYEAWFGYDHPNDDLPFAKYNDVGPNKVQSVKI